VVFWKLYPNHGVTQLRKINPSLFMYLYRKDRIWIKKNSSRQKRINNIERVNWKERDDNIALMIERAAIKIFSNDPPRRVTTTGIGNELGHRALFEKHLNKLPKCEAALKKYIEEKASFQIRRIQYFVEKLNKEHEEIQEWKIKRHIGFKTTQSKEIQDAIEEQINLFK
jgi:hypothetical protein